MRSNLEIKNRFLHRLEWSLKRPGMYGQGRGLETLYRFLLKDLCFIDEKDEGLPESKLEDLDLWSATGVCGVLYSELHPNCEIEDDLASVYAQIASGLSYLQLDQTLSKEGL